MRTAVQRVVIRKPGGWNRLELCEEPTPRPGPGEVLIRTQAIGVNYADCVVRMGLYRSAKEYVGWPITPGFECAGEVEAVGDGVVDLQVGQRVLGLTRFGGYSTHVVAPRAQVFTPALSWSACELGGFSVVALTAWYALRELCRLRPGMQVLIHSGAGGVGSAATQIARRFGAEVTSVVGAAHKVETARQLGATHVVVREEGSWSRAARQRVPQGFDIVLDPNGGSMLRKSYELLRPAGRLVVYGAHSFFARGQQRPNLLRLLMGLLTTPRFHPLSMIDRNCGVLAFNLSYLFERSELLGEAMSELEQWAQRGELAAPRVQEFLLADVARAHQALESGQTVGKLVLTPGSSP